MTTPGDPRGGGSAHELLEALTKLPPFEDVVFRGWRDSDVWSSGAGSLVTSGVTPTSRDPRVATENFTTTGVYAIAVRTGRAIEAFSAHREEREVVLLPATVLVWRDRARVGDLVVTLIDEVVLEDVHDDGARRAPADVDEVVAARVRAALARDDVVVAQPGKFVGVLE